jgi:hypothetical protein
VNKINKNQTINKNKTTASNQSNKTGNQQANMPEQNN